MVVQGSVVGDQGKSYNQVSLKGTRCLGSDQLVYKQRLKPFVMKVIMVRKMF